MAKTVAVIGAGASGLTAIKCCLDEGLEPVCFERTQDIGGLWNYSDTAVEGQGSVAKTTVINTSKEMMCYSDFPAPKEFPNYMHNEQLMKYFRLYADNFDLLKHIKFQKSVKNVRRAEDFSKNGQWNFDVKDLKTDNVTSENFDAVLLCTGHHADRNIPRFPGDDKFKGTILHTNEYKDHVKYVGKRVVIIGFGNSGGDAAVELSRVAKKVFLSTRRGSWVLNRVAPNGFPMDVFNNTRAKFTIARNFPSLFISMREQYLNNRFNHEAYGLRPKHRVNQAHPTVNDELPTRILSGMVVIKPNVTCFTETGVEFEDGTKEDNIDVVILATGYVFGFPYLEPGVIPVKKNQVSLYKYVFPPDLDQPTIAVVGCVQPWGAINPISELNCRWATRVFKGLEKLPPKQDMLADIERKKNLMAKRYVASQRHTIQVDFIPHMDELANQIGVKPDVWKIFKSDPVLGMKLFFGPCTPYQYRLQGPGQWSGARDAIMTLYDRIYAALNTRKADPEPRGWLPIVVLVVIVAVLIRWIFF